MYLSRLTLHTGNSQARKDIGNPHNLHRTIMSAFPSPMPEKERVLFRVEKFENGESQRVLVQSLTNPDWGALELKFPGYFVINPEVKALETLKIQPGDWFRFRLRANPSKRVLYQHSGRSQRISLFSEKDRREWIMRKAAKAGFSLDTDRLLIRDAPYRTIFISKQDRTHKATLNMVDFDGLLRVEDASRFLDNLQAGIGPAKGLGCGLLSLARA